MDQNSQPKIDLEFLKTRPLSYSALKNFDISPRDYIHYLTADKKAPTDQMIMGQATECLVFEPDKFNDKFIPHKPFERRSNAGKLHYEQMILQARSEKKTLIEESLIPKCQEMVNSVLNNEKIQPYLEGVTRTQKKLTWTDPVQGLPMIGYVDAEGEYNGDFMIEFKTTKDGSADGWIRESYGGKYHLQIGMYKKGYRESDYSHPDQIFVISENKEPYKSNIFRCPSNYVEQCVEEVDYLLVCFKYCMDNDLFHLGYEFWMLEMPFNQMALPGYNRLRSKI